jgi:ABC-2 type transport system ATP-binding protein
MIILDKVSKSFETELFKPKKRVLNQISLEIKKGSITGFLGANGAGKSTIIKLIMGFIKADEGKLNFNKDLGSTKKSIYSKIGFLPERPFFYPHLTGREFLQYLGGLNDLRPMILREKIDLFSTRLSLKNHLDKKINNYSKGMLQRLGIISCLIHDPMLLILDEPLSGMDPPGRKEIKEILLECHENGKTIFFSSHILSDVEEICDRVIVLDAGSLKFQGYKTELLPIKNTFIVKLWGKIENIKSNCIHEIKNKSGITEVEIPEENLQEFLGEVLVSGSKIHSIKRKNSTMDEMIFGIS